MAEQVHDRLKTLSRLDRWQKEKAVSSLLDFPLGEVIAALEAGVRDQTDADIRNASMEIFRLLGNRALPCLGCLISDDDPEVRLFAANILHEIGDPASLSLLLGAAGDNDVNVRTAVVEALGRIQDSQALPALIPLLDDEPWVASSAVNAIGMIGGDKARAILHACLDREALRPMAVLALARCGDHETVSHLMQHMRNEELSAQVVQAVVSIGERCPDAAAPAIMRPATDQFIVLYASPDPAVQRAAPRFA